MALNGGPQFKFSEAVPFFVRCETQAEIAYFVAAPSRRWRRSKSVRLVEG
jgi:predicted 3-demethylubiquinone-9 3-methyltransferase (glyoxalase superfamily)